MEFTSGTEKKKKGLGNGGVGVSPSEKSAKPTTRSIKSAEQLKLLEETYSIDANPSRNVKVELGIKLGLTPRQVQLWFCDKRRRDGKKKMVMDSSSQRNGIMSVPLDGDQKMGCSGDQHVSHESSSRSESGLGSSRFVLKARGINKAVDTPMLGGSVREADRPIDGVESDPVLDELPTVPQWKRMPNIESYDECQTTKIEKSPLKRIRCEDGASWTEDKGLSEEAHRIYGELKRGLRRREMEQCDGETSKKQQYQVGVPSTKQAYHGKQSVGFAYCAETGECFIYRRRPLNPVTSVSQEEDISKSAKKQHSTDPAAMEEKRIRRTLELQEIRRRKRKEMQGAMRECLKMEETRGSNWRDVIRA